MTREELLDILLKEDFTLITEPNGNIRSKVKIGNKIHESNEVMSSRDIPRNSSGKPIWEDLFLKSAGFSKVLDDLLNQVNNSAEFPEQTMTIWLDYTGDHHYYDKHGQKINNTGELEVVVEGDKSLGFLATKKDWEDKMSAVEIYPLSEFNLKEWEIVEEDNNVS